MKNNIFIIILLSGSLHSCAQESNINKNPKLAFYHLLNLSQQNKPLEIEKMYIDMPGLDVTGLYNNNKIFDEAVSILNQFGIPDTSKYQIWDDKGSINVSVTFDIKDSVDLQYVFWAQFKLVKNEYKLLTYLTTFIPNPYLDPANNKEFKMSPQDSVTELTNPYTFSVTWTNSNPALDGSILLLDYSEIKEFINQFRLDSLFSILDMPKSDYDFELYELHYSYFGKGSIQLVYNYILPSKKEAQLINIIFLEEGIASLPSPFFYIYTEDIDSIIIVEKDSEYYKMYLNFIEKLSAHYKND